jgi:tRNA threonylcarbamoyl adenosine modification protein (Sua5/YciO/YrdC/YwlC family)
MIKNILSVFSALFVSLMLIVGSCSFSISPIIRSFSRKPGLANSIMVAAASISDTAFNTTIDNSVDTSKPRPQIKAKILNDISVCGERLRLGELVAFPTETVYGLGCHALDVEAVAKVFAAKERPLTDPLIVHVLEPRDAFSLWKQENPILSKLCNDFWPGPLTLVAEANSKVPSTIMAGTGYCACRSPSHSTARALLEAAQVPIAAPSANKFGHVSPTTAQHVFDDLQYEDVWILETEGQEGPCCDVGVESTVAKLEETQEGGYLLTVLRQGAVSVHTLKDSLTGLPVEVVAKLKRATKDDVANVAPGQTIRHYSPNIPSFLLSPACVKSELRAELLSHSVVIDYGGQLAHWKDHCLAYRDLTPDGSSSAAAQTVFDTLRWAEQVPGASYVLFPELPDSSDALELAVKDRLTRAASGIIINALEEATAVLAENS